MKTRMSYVANAGGIHSQNLAENSNGLNSAIVFASSPLILIYCRNHDTAGIKLNGCSFERLVPFVELSSPHHV